MLADDPQNIKRTCCLVSKRTLLAWHLLSSMDLKLSVSISIWMLLISKIRNGPVKQDKLPLHLLLELKSNSFYKIRKCGLLNHNEGMIIIQKCLICNLTLHILIIYFYCFLIHHNNYLFQLVYKRSDA
ncbi:unnamed protein product [Rhizophagus irregularis]|uniref:Uncharacterized protein n=1 Tax=Rhizophagus irregularis TaxID=588596 RepID=A0A915ZA00_9GLOM|nr:unnamed protein product [Rhizophagus irregularis]CAB5367769.1 unnamed protein product [Rhizophagus irregularis]